MDLTDLISKTITVLLRWGVNKDWGQEQGLFKVLGFQPVWFALCPPSTHKHLQKQCAEEEQGFVSGKHDHTISSRRTDSIMYQDTAGACGAFAHCCLPKLWQIWNCRWFCSSYCPHNKCVSATECSFELSHSVVASFLSSPCQSNPQAHSVKWKPPDETCQSCVLLP